MKQKQRKLEEMIKTLKSGRQGGPVLGDLRHHRGRGGRRLRPAHRPEHQDPGPEERGGRPARRPPTRRRSSRCPRPREPLRPLARCWRRPWPASPTPSCGRSCAPAPSSTARSSLACGVALWPPYATGDKPGKIKLGLDLRGGMHLVHAGGGGRRHERHRRRRACRPCATSSAARASSFGCAQRVDTTSFSVEGVEPARVKDARDMLQGLLPRRLGGPRAGRGPLPGADDGAAAGPDQGPHGEGGDQGPWSGASTSSGWRSP